MTSPLAVVLVRLPTCNGHSGRAVLVSASAPVPVPSPVLAAGTRLADGLVRPGGGRVAGQDAVELAPGTAGELGGDLAKVVPNRARADELPGSGARGDLPPA